MKTCTNIFIITLLIDCDYPNSRMESAPPEGAYIVADFIFSGEVKNIFLDGSEYYLGVAFQIIDVWKGEYLEEITDIKDTYTNICKYM